MDSNWFKIWPGKLRTVASSLPTGLQRAYLMQIAVVYLDEGGLPADSTKIAFKTSLPVEAVNEMAQFWEHLGRVENDQLHLDFLDDVLEERAARLRIEGLLRGDWSKVREQILRRDKYTCGYCGGHANCVDHIIPRIQGGGNDSDNLISSCIPCNSRKGGRTSEQAGMPIVFYAGFAVAFSDMEVTQ